MIVTGHKQVLSIEAVGGADSIGQYVAILKNETAVTFPNLGAALAAYGLEIVGESARFAHHICCVERGGASRTARRARCTCGWIGSQRHTLSVAADDGMHHEEFHLMHAIREVLAEPQTGEARHLRARLVNLITTDSGT